MVSYLSNEYLTIYYLDEFLTTLSLRFTYLDKSTHFETEEF